MVVVALRLTDDEGTMTIEEMCRPDGSYTENEKKLGKWILNKIKQSLPDWMSEISDAPVEECKTQEELDAKLKDAKKRERQFHLEIPDDPEKKKMFDAFFEALPQKARDVIKARIENISKTFEASTKFGELTRV